MYAPMERPYRTQTDCGMTSPKITTDCQHVSSHSEGSMGLPIKTVLPRTAGHPPPRDLSSIMGRVSLTMTLLRSSVTSTQCFPLCSRSYTFFACCCSLPSPEVAITCRYTPSCPINLNKNVRQFTSQNSRWRYSRNC